MFSQVVSIVFPLFFIVGVGYFYGTRVRPEMRITNQLVMDVFMPALILHVMVQDDFYPSRYLNLTIAGALVMLGSGAVAFVIAKLLGFGRSFMPPAMFSNWANLGLPLYVLALGDAALGGGVVLVVIGNLLCFTLGVYLYSSRLTSFEFLRTPIIVAVILGAAFNMFDIRLPNELASPIEMMSRVAIPLMLFSLGVRLTRVSFSHLKVGLSMAVLSPVVGIGLALILVQLIPMSSLQQNTLILFGALPPAVINFMLAEQYNCDPDQVASMVIIGNLAAIIAIPLALLLVLS